MATAKTSKTSATRPRNTTTNSTSARSSMHVTSAGVVEIETPATLPANLPPMAEESRATQQGEPTYPVDFVVANNSYNGNNTYCLNLTDRQIRLLLMDSDSPRWVKIPAHYYQANGNKEMRYLNLSNVAEVHVSNDWQPPDNWEWGDITAKLDALD